MVCEVMGRHAGWIAIMSGMAGGADVILTPERPVTVERCCELIRKRHAKGKDFSIVVVSEGWELRTEDGEAQLVDSGTTDRSGTSTWAASANPWAARSSRGPGSRRA